MVDALRGVRLSSASATPTKKFEPNLGQWPETLSSNCPCGKYFWPPTGQSDHFGSLGVYILYALCKALQTRSLQQEAISPESQKKRPQKSVFFFVAVDNIGSRWASVSPAGCDLTTTVEHQCKAEMHKYNDSNAQILIAKWWKYKKNWIKRLVDIQYKCLKWENIKTHIQIQEKNYTNTIFQIQLGWAWPDK